MHNDGMKRSGDSPATKGDLESLAATMVTKTELKTLAATLATKDELKTLAATMDGRMHTLVDRMDTLTEHMDTMTSVIRRMAVEIVNTQTKMTNMHDKLFASMKAMGARLTTTMDTFMSRTLKVDHDNVFLIHRMDKVERRVSALERRVPS